MTTLVDVMLEVARKMGLVYEGIATSGTTSSLTDAGLEAIADHYQGGTLWITSGDNGGEIAIVKTHDGNTLTFVAMDNAIVADVGYAVAAKDYSKQLIKQAVLDVLRYDQCLLKDDTLTVTADTEVYTLPTGVENVLSVHVAKNSSEPYSFIPNHHWREVNGSLMFERGRYPVMENRIIRIWYQGYHGEISESGTVKATVPIRWLVWKSIENLYRKKYVYLQKNSPEQIELLNEAKENVKYAQLTAEKFELRTMNPQPKLANY